MSWRCVFSPALSMRRSAAVTRPEAEAALAEAAADLGSAARPSNNRTSSRSISRIVSRMQRSSPCGKKSQSICKK